MSNRPLPPQAKEAQAKDDGRLILPAAERNAPAITELVKTYGPKTGNALELASGAGQHISRLAKEIPGITWQPTEVDEERMISIDLYCKGLTNVNSAQWLDATIPGWATRHGNKNLILLINLTHLLSMDEVETLITEVGQALSPGGQFILYGPFSRGGELTSEGDITFQQALQNADPSIGYKDDFDITDLIHANQMDLTDLIEMPANNLAFVAQRFG
jgi:hypothetical protein